MSSLITVRAAFTQRIPASAPAALPQWSVALSESSINEGASVDLTVSFNLNGYSPSVGELGLVTLTSMTDADFAAAFSGETQAKLSSGDFTTGFTALMTAAIEAIGGTAETTTVGGITALILSFPLDGTTSVSITRVTVERSGDNGSRRLVHQILSPSVGELSAASDSCVIVDTTGASAGGDLDYLTVSPDYADAAHIDTAATIAVAGTRIGEIFGFDTDDAAKTLSAVSIIDGLDGRFKITQETTHFYLDVDSGPGLVDFEDWWTGTSGQINRRPGILYKPVVSATSGAITVQQALVVRPRYGAIEPDGNDTGSTPLEATSYATFDSYFTGTGNDTTVKIASSWTGVAARGALSTLDRWTRSRSTLIGHPEHAFRHSRGFIFRQGNDIVVYNVAFRVGVDLAIVTTTKAFQEVDNLNVCYENPSAWSRNIIFKNCSFSCSNDEAARVKGEDGWFCRGVRFLLCNFFNAIYDGNHPKGNGHNYGPAVSPGNANVMFQLCAFGNTRNRMPRINRVAGTTCWNNVHFNWFDNSTRGAVELTMGAVGAGNYEFLTARVENSLFYKFSGTRDYAIRVEAASDVNKAWLYLNGNHFFNKLTDTFTDDLLTTSNGIGLMGGSVAGAIRETAPFELGTYSDYPLMPASSAAERRAIEDLIVGPVNGLSGCRQLDASGNPVPGDDALNAFDRDVLEEYRTGAGTRDSTQAYFSGKYAADWNGPGTEGNGMAELI